jgi:hypothetical protein
MILRLLLAGVLSLAITPNAFAQRVDLKAFGTVDGSKQPSALRVTGPEIRENLPDPDNPGRLVDDFAALGVVKSMPQAGTKVSRHRGIAKGLRSEQPARILSPFDAAPHRGGCEHPSYTPSPHLPREAEQRRSIWYSAMAEAACDAGVPVHLFDALIIQESRYNPVAVSPKGATGLSQLMPASARILGVRNIWDPRENMRGGARYLRALLDEFGRFDLALAAYNAGAGRVRATGRVPRIAETIHYVSSILVTMQRQLSAPMPLRE